MWFKTQDIYGLLKASTDRDPKLSLLILTADAFEGLSALGRASGIGKAPEWFLCQDQGDTRLMCDSS